jgi:subtilase family serine protease
MSFDTRKIGSIVVLSCLVLLLIALPSFAQAAKGIRIAPTPQILGPETQSKQISVTFWLKQHDKAGFDALVRQMYDRNSPNFHKWLNAKEYSARFAPTVAEMAIVKQHLAANNLKIVSTDKLNLAVTARGAVADVQRATGVQLNRVSLNGEMHRLPSSALAIPGVAGKLVYAVQGLNDFTYKNHAKIASSPDTGKPFMMPLSKMTPLSTVGPALQYFNANCLMGKQGHEFTDGLTPPIRSAHYTGSRYGDNIYNPPPNLPPCGYDAPQIDSAYGLTSLYKTGLDGSGQTVDIVDAFGSDSITSDANIFASINGLPALVPGTNFFISYPGGPTNCGGNTCGWDVETSLDVEWAHSLAPGASIALYLAVTNSFEDLDVAVLTAVEDGYAPVISNSYGAPELLLLIYDTPELDIQDAINQLGAAFGESVNFSTGDDGDDYAYLLNNYGLPYTSPESPSTSPYATAVGGTSLFVTTGHKGQTASIKLQTGWGNNVTKIAEANPNPPTIPPLNEGFIFGAGGGASYYFAPPDYQSSLWGDARLVPDIAMVADPYTGVEVIDTEGETFITVVGGTSLACPAFSGIWAIANQAVGGWIGQAAPILYDLPADAITDILQVNGPANVTGRTHVVHGTPPTVNYAAADLMQPLDGTTEFVSTLYQGATSTRWYVLGFGLDTSLATGPGWDDVTGLGTPSATFVSDVAALIP